MNFFSAKPFLETFGECFFPGQQRSIGLYEVEGAVYRLLVVEGRPILQWSFLDLLEPLDEVPRDAQPKPLSWLPRVAKGVVAVEAWRAVPDTGGDVCPLVDWRGFASWDDYAAIGPRCSRDPDSRRRRRVLERDLGPLAITIDEEGADALEAAIRWKSAHYRATGQPDVFRDPRHARFYAALHARGLVRLSSLRAGGRLLAVHLCVRDAGRRRVWMQAYDAAWVRGSPGRLLHEAVLEHSYRSGERECDMLLGSEPYKFDYATHVRLCGPVGREPLAARVMRRARPHIRRALQGQPWLQSRMRNIRQYFSDR